MTHDRPDPLEAALAEAVASIHDRGAAPETESVDYRSLGIGLRLGLDRPGHARHLLELIGAAGADAGAVGGAAVDVVAADVVPAGPAEAASPGEPATDLADGGVPPASLFLARSAAFSLAERAELGPDVVFGWATELSAGQVLRIGAVVAAMLAEGAPTDLGRGFALAWDDGVKIPRHERDALFADFAQLQVAVGGVLVGRDLRVEEAVPKQRGFGAFAQLFGGRSNGPSPATAAIEAAGEPGRRALVAMWNTWIAMRYRASIHGPTFALLTRPWVTVVGPLPER